ncbi:ergosterol biosynthesis protein [Vermiconidia calcicola]|uniref:Ergosterol biosynthesis protein n=1 Tax=Vermiconidia calcicola TaxID=1690605 RepID=A0ACC3MT09_9PEZI|nr:ergosterol biosynthesis protein [Vermiconidia calcicola]
MASQLSSYLPPSEGLLPKWLLFISVVSIGNSIQSYMSLKGTREVYAGSSPSAVTPLSARTFGTWTAITSIIRLYGAYNIDNKAVYELCMWTFGIAWLHFVSEWLAFGTAKLGRGLAGPLIVATATGTWMLSQWSGYVK